MKYLSLFSGIGGFELGIQQAYEELCNANRSENRRSEEDSERNKGQRLQSTQGEEVSSEKGQSCKCTTNISHERPLCIGYSEIDKHAIQIYKKHFNHQNYGNITTIIPNELPDFDLLVGGFPCQAFSIAGKRGGFDDTRGTLFFDIARILADKKPRNFILENVKGLLSHDSGKTFQTILKVLSDIGYRVEWQVLNSKNFGVPQNRERVFIVGHLRGTSRPEVFPIGESGKENDRTVARTINSSDWRGGNRNQQQNTVAIPVLTPDRPEKRQNGRRFKTDGEPAFTCTAQDKHGVYDGMRIRRLTPTECERLQGFPDGWTEGVSDTQRYKTLGNAVTVNVVKAIILKL